MIAFSALAGLFLAAFLAATPVPFQSEIAFVAALGTGVAPIWAILTVASLGNTLGSFVNYALGAGIDHYSGRRWFPVTPAQLDRASRWFRKWGVWALLFSWAPGGDLVCVMAGVLRTPLWLFALLVAVAKTSRYAVLAWLTTQALG